MSNTNGQGAKRIRPRIDIIWDPKDVDAIREMAELTGQTMKQVVQTATRLHLKKETARLAKLSKLRAKLLPN